MENNICYAWDNLGVEMQISTCEECDVLNICERDISTDVSIKDKDKDHQEFMR